MMGASHQTCSVVMVAVLLIGVFTSISGCERDYPVHGSRRACLQACPDECEQTEHHPKDVDDCINDCRNDCNHD